MIWSVNKIAPAILPRVYPVDTRKPPVSGFLVFTRWAVRDLVTDNFLLKISATPAPRLRLSNPAKSHVGGEGFEPPTFMV